MITEPLMDSRLANSKRKNKLLATEDLTSSLSVPTAQGGNNIPPAFSKYQL